MILAHRNGAKRILRDLAIVQRSEYRCVAHPS